MRSMGYKMGLLPRLFESLLCISICMLYAHVYGFIVENFKLKCLKSFIVCNEVLNIFFKEKNWLN